MTNKSYLLAVKYSSRLPIKVHVWISLCIITINMELRTVCIALALFTGKKLFRYIDPEAAVTEHKIINAY